MMLYYSMLGKETNHLNDLDARWSINEDKPAAYLAVKLHVYQVAIHRWELRCMDEATTENEEYRFVPLPNEAFVDLVIDAFCALGMNKNKRFLDVGAGFGSKVLLASPLFDAYGFDCVDRYVKQAQQLLGDKVFLADALTFDRYYEYDVVYYYRPIKDNDLYFQLERRIYDALRPGMLVAPMHSLIDWGQLPDMQPVGRYLFQKS